MKKLIVIFTLFQLFSCEKQSEPSEKLIKNTNGEIYIAILDSYHYPPINDKSSWLTKDEVTKVDKILNAAVEKLNVEQEADYYKYGDKSYKLEQFLIDLKNYKRQYLPYTNENGEKIVWVNCLCKVRSEIWKTEFYGVDGGGHCYFDGYINLSKNNFNGFRANGPL